jgi:ring-1,2-phenylacetyl-CoA epoxidase subunit PaaD
MIVKSAIYNKGQIWKWLEEVTDPEIPVLNIIEMGIVRSVSVDGEKAIIKITPTYSGCPAMAAIEQNIRTKMAEKGIEQIEVKKDFSEPWTTGWMSEIAREKLKNYGIAPPEIRDEKNGGGTGLYEPENVSCPYCDSTDTELRSEFGSTPCKALYYCNRCEEPFEHFKCI